MATFAMRLRQGCMALLLVTWALLAGAQPVQDVPALTARVIDQTQTLSNDQRQVLDNKLALVEKELGTQIVVLMVPSTSPEDIAAYANRVGNAWKIGRKEIGDGLLIVVAKNDHRLRIEVAKALEGAVPDVAAKHIIDEAMTPRFKHDDFAGGINAGIDRLVELVQKEKLPAPVKASDGGSDGGGWREPVKTLALWFVGAEILLTLTLAFGGFLMGLLWSASGALLAALADGVIGQDSITVKAGFVGYVLGAVLLIRWATSNISSSSAAVATPKPPAPKPAEPKAPEPKATESSSSSTSGSWWSNWSSGSSSDSDSSSFSSGGGGDFGGGGASGSW